MSLVLYNHLAVHAIIDPICEPSILEELRGEIESDLSRRLDTLVGPDSLQEAIRYAVLNGGKRLRPALTLLSCQAVGGSRSDALAAGSALELIHSFSLVHDDLPAMDDDELRRGRPTLHVQAGEAMAILAGDAMMSLAFQWITDKQQDMSKGNKLTQELADATTRMIVGQVYDTLGGFPADSTPAQKLKLTHQNKTAALIRAACRMGGICADSSEDQLNALTTYGEAIGLMFQIVDDLLDVTQSTEHVGKATNKDQQAGKLTCPSILGPDESKAQVQQLRNEAKKAIALLGKPANPLIELCDYLAVRTK